METEQELYQATLPHFCCGFLVENQKIVDAAPIMRWAVGKSLAEFVRWARGKGGKVERVLSGY